MRTLRWLLPAIPAIYSVIALCAVYIINRYPSPGIEPILAIVVAPLIFIFQPLYPLLKPLRLLEGEWMQGPKPLGVLVGAALYWLLLWIAVRLIWPKRNTADVQR